MTVVRATKQEYIPHIYIPTAYIIYIATEYFADSEFAVSID